MTTEKKLIAFTLYPGVTPLDLVGPLTVLRKLGPGWPFQTVVVGERIAAMNTDTPPQLIPTATFDDVPTPFAIIVPGGGPAALEAMHNEPLPAYVRAAAETADVVGSTGNGALILAAAGLLHGRQAAIHGAYSEQLDSAGARYVRDRWLDQGKLLTAAGGTAGIDLMLHLVARFKNESSAKLAQLFTEYDPRPPFGGIDWANVPLLPRVIRGAMDRGQAQAAKKFGSTETCPGPPASAHPGGQQFGRRRGHSALPRSRRRPVGSGRCWSDRLAGNGQRSVRGSRARRLTLRATAFSERRRGSGACQR